MDVSPTKYSEHLGEIKDECFQAALKKLGLGDFVSAKPVSYGLFGQNIFLTSTQGELVFRGRPLWHGQFENECFMVTKLHQETRIPVPWPYQVNKPDDLFGWSYIIMPRLPGLPLENAEVQKTLSAEDHLGLAVTMAENLLELQKLKYPHCGLYDVSTNSVAALDEVYIPPWSEKLPANSASSVGQSGSPEEIYQRWYISRIKERLNYAIDCNDRTSGGKTTRGDVDWVESVLRDYKDSLLVPFQPCFVMDDYKEGNTTCEKVDGKWKITGLFDFGTAYFGDGEADLSRLLATYGIGDTQCGQRARVFLKAYLKGKHQGAIRPQFVERACLYLLMDWLVMWAFFRNRISVDKFPDFRSWCESSLRASHNHLTAIVRDVFD